MKPIEVFKSKEELNICLKWWQEKLFLTDWIIKARIANPEDFAFKDSCGENEFSITEKCCIIRILDLQYYGDGIMKYCAEKILVHELLHCKYEWMENKGSYEREYVDTVEHSLLEQMAKSLIMAKYDLDFEYFDNVEVD